LPYVPKVTEAELLHRLKVALDSRRIAAVFIEPLQGSAGGHLPSKEFFQGLRRLCTETETLLVLDEIFTGFHRAGPAFLHQEFGISGDVVLIGKALGNGFPVSAVICDRRIDISAKMLPSSTYSSNPLAAAVVTATLRRLSEIGVADRVQRIDATVRRELKGLAAQGVNLRGRGALWVLEFGTEEQALRVARQALSRGVLAAPTAKYLRLLPPATIGLERLVTACSVLAECCAENAGGVR